MTVAPSDRSTTPGGLPIWRTTESMRDAVLDALAEAGMEIVYADHEGDGPPVYMEAGSDVLKPLALGMTRALALDPEGAAPLREALVIAQESLHDLCLERGSTEQYRQVFDGINAALGRP